MKLNILGVYKARKGGERGMVTTIPSESKLFRKIKSGERLLIQEDERGRIVIDIAEGKSA